MRKTEAKKILFNHLKPFFLDNGYKLVTSKFSEFIKNFDDGMDWIHIDANDYNTRQNVYYTVMKRINIVDEIWQEVDKRYFNVQRANIEFSNTLRFSYETINNLNHSTYLPDIIEEADVKANKDLIIEFMTNIALPLLERFNDTREIDKEINGADFWKDDWRKPYQIGNFPFHRLIIAHLCSNKNFNDLSDYHFNKWKENLKEFPKCQNLIDACSFLLDILKDVKPLH